MKYEIKQEVVDAILKHLEQLNVPIGSYKAISIELTKTPIVEAPKPDEKL